MNTPRDLMILTAFALSLNACSSAPAEPDPDPLDQEPEPTEVALEFIGDQPYASFEAFAEAIGSADFKEESIMLGAEGKEGAAQGFITSGGLVARDGATQRVLLAGKPGALYEVAVLDSWTESPNFMPYAQVSVRAIELPSGLFEITYNAGRTREVEGGTYYVHTGTSLICKDADGRLACATFIVSNGDYVEPEEGAADYELPNGIIVGREGSTVEVVHLVTGEDLTPAGYYTLTGP
jgi:hypothetical protein